MFLQKIKNKLKIKQKQRAFYNLLNKHNCIVLSSEDLPLVATLKKNYRLTLKLLVLDKKLAQRIIKTKNLQN